MNNSTPEMQDLARSIYKTSHLTGQFTLRSGAVSNEYFDKYLFESQPDVLEKIARQMLKLIPADTDLLAGLEMGGIPVVTLLSHYAQIPCIFVRKQAKNYGTAKLAEGPDFTGKKLTIIEDVVSSGGQIILSTQDLRNAGAQITEAICVIDRQSGGKEKLADQDINLQSLFTMTALKDSVQNRQDG